MTNNNHRDSGGFVPDYELETDLSDYSALAQEIIRNRDNMGTLPEPGLVGKVKGCCGDSIQIELRLTGDIIQEARFTTDGCSATVAVGGMITNLVKGKTLNQAQQISSKDIIESLGGLPNGHRHCADLAIKTLHATLQRE